MWINGFNWRQWGKRLAHGANAMIDEWDADALGRAIADKFRAAWNFFGGFVENFDFSGFGEKLKEGIRGAIDELNPKDMGKTLGTFLTGIGTTLKSLFKDGTLRKDVSDAVSEFVNGFLESFDAKEINEGINAFVDTVVGGIADAIGKADKVKLTENFLTLLTGLPWGAIAVGIGVVAVPKLVAALFGTAFKYAVMKKIAGLGLAEAISSSVGGSATTSGTVASTASASGAITLGKITAATLGVTAITLGGIALGKWLDKKLRTLFPSYGKAADAQKNAKESGATGSSTSYSDVWKDFGKYTPGGGTSGSTASQTPSPKGTSTTNTVTTVLKGITDGSFKQLQVNTKELAKNPTVTKTLDGVQTPKFKTGAEAFHALKNGTATKTVNGTWTSGFTRTKNDYHGIKNNKATKTAHGVKTSGFNSTSAAFKAIVSNRATKTAHGTRTNGFNTAYTKYNELEDKNIDIYFNIKTSAKKIIADYTDAAGNAISKAFATFRMENAKGGLFTGPVGFQVFGEAGAEAAIPLERKSTMKRIASAIVDSGGMGTSNSDEIADAIAMRVLPAMAQMLDGQNQRPINVNATLYTENNEVLAKAVNRGNRSLDKRYHPVAQYGY
jgi:hypothetical protein